MSRTQKRRFAPSEQPLLETLLAAALAIVHSQYHPSTIDPWAKISDNDAQVIFQTGAGVVAIIASLAALGLATGGAGSRATAMRTLYGPELRRNWRALLLTSAIAPLLAVTAQILAASGVGWAPYLFEFAVVWTALRLARLAWLVDSLLGQEIDDENAARQAVPQLPVTSDFRKRMGA
jgi:hypothetical protein